MVKYKFSILIFFASVCSVFSADYLLRHEYKFSFKGPNLSKGTYQVPFWSFNGDAVPGGDQIRIVPSLRDKSGGVWSKYPFPSDAWQVEVKFRIHGRGRIGADGMVVWLVEKPSTTGPVFGSMDMWKGLGVFLDSYDNDGAKNNPYISVIMNDGTKTYNHKLDGSDTKLAGCLRDIRNRVYPSRLRLTYWKKNLEVEIDPGNSDGTDYEPCASVADIDIPSNYYFGITAATGGLADDHDVISFTTHSLQEPGAPSDVKVEDQAENKENEIEKKEEESYKQKMDEFEMEAKKFREAHPDLAKTQRPDLDSVEESSSPELRSILDVQSQIKSLVTSSMKAMSTILKRQEEMLPKLEQAAAKSNTAAADNAGGGAATIPQDYATKVDMRNIVDTIKLTVEAIEDVKNKLNLVGDQSADVRKGLQLLESKVSGINAGSSGTTVEVANSAIKTREQLEYVTKLLIDVQAKQNKQPSLSCPPPPPSTCLSFGSFLIVILLQLAVLLGYHMMKYSQEAARKKFF